MANKIETNCVVIAYHTHTTMAMSKEQHEQLIAETLQLESSGPIAPAPPGRAPPPPPPTLEMQRQLLFAKIFALAKTVITKEKLVALTTKNGDTQASERTSIPLVKSVLNQLGLTYTEAGSQQSKDFRNVGGIGLDIEVKKTDGNTVTFNDTCPNKDIWYLILLHGEREHADEHSTWRARNERHRVYGRFRVGLRLPARDRRHQGQILPRRG